MFIEIKYNKICVKQCQEYNGVLSSTSYTFEKNKRKQLLLLNNSIVSWFAGISNKTM